MQRNTKIGKTYILLEIKKLILQVICKFCIVQILHNCPKSHTIISAIRIPKYLTQYIYRHIFIII